MQIRAKIKNTEDLAAGVTSRRNIVFKVQRGDYKLPNHWEFGVNNESRCRPLDPRTVTVHAELAVLCRDPRNVRFSRAELAT